MTGFTGSSGSAAGSGRTLRVDWPCCEARGLCAEVLPEMIDLDEWGFPVVRVTVPQRLLREAQEAVLVCPRRALRLAKG